MSNFLKFKVDLNGKTQNVVIINYKSDTEKTVGKEYDAIHHIHIIDRSWSMIDDIDELINNVQKTIDCTGDNDLITISWYSGPGEFRVPLKAAKKFDQMKNILNSMRDVISTTCFSDILKEMNIVLKELSSIDMPVSITLFTDGQPVVPWSVDEEKRRIFMEIEEMKSFLGNKLIAFNTIGYGNYYNLQLLTDIADMTEYGSFLHNNRIDQYYDTFRLNHEKIKENVYEPVELYTKHESEFMYLNRRHTKHEKFNMKLNSIDKEKNQFFIVMRDNEKFFLNDIQYSLEGIKERYVPEATVNNFLYAYAYNMYYKQKYKESLNVLAKNIKDRGLIDSHFRAFTLAEKGEHIHKLKTSLFKPKERFLEGVAPVDYVPKKDAMCVMDIIVKLKEIGAIWVPFHKELDDYKRIGKKTEESFDMFKQIDDEIRGNFEDLVFNKEFLNLSVRVKINGYVTLNPKQAKKIGLEPEFKCHKFRNYTLIKNGNLNMDKIMVLIPDHELSTFRVEAELLSGNVEIEGKFYSRIIINLSKYPVINQLYAEESSSIEKVFHINKRILQLEAEQKILNYYIKSMADKAALKKEGVFKKLTVEQIELLKDYGISKDGVYSGIGGKEVVTGDSYITRVLNFYFAGVSSLPPVEKMLERIQSGKKLTANMEVLNEGYEKVNMNADSDNINFNQKIKNTKTWLDGKLKSVKKELYHLRDVIAIMKIAIVLTGNWFQLEVDEKNNYYFEKDGIKMICKADYREVKI